LRVSEKKVRPEFPMRTFRILLGLLSSIAILAMIWYAYEVFLVDPLADREEYRQQVTQGLRALGATEPDWRTMVIAATVEIEGQRDRVWEEWSKLEKWPEWSLHRSRAIWKAGTDWKVGGKFEEVLDLGWPYDMVRALERIELVFVPDRVAYVREGGMPVSYRFWRFEYVPGGGTRVSSVEVLHSNEIGFLRPLIEKRWQQKLEGSLRGLAQFVARAK
jgi:hypothetical protein